MTRIYTPLFAASLSLLACGPSAPPPATPAGAPSASASTSAAIDATPTAEPPPTASATAEEKPIALSMLGANEVTVKVGAKLVFAYTSHGSVGYGAKHHLDAQTVVRFVSDDVTFDKPEASRKGMTGADAGTGRMVFEAVAKGRATLEVEELFRGTVRNSAKFTIIVE